MNINKVLVSTCIIPAMERMNGLVNEIQWRDRLDFNNHSVHYPFRVTGICDTFPVEISQPDDPMKRAQSFNGKYGCCVVKA